MGSIATGDSEQIGAAEATIRIEFFGGLRVVVGGVEIIHFGPHKAAALLALLALRPNRRHERDEIAQLIWPKKAPADTLQRLAQHLYKLRGSIPGGHDLILADPRSIRLSDDQNIFIDVHEYD